MHHRFLCVSIQASRSSKLEAQKKGTKNEDHGGSRVHGACVRGRCGMGWGCVCENVMTYCFKMT